MKYSDLPKNDQPANRLREASASALSTADLLAVALRVNDVETAQSLAARYFDAGSLSGIDRSDVLAIKGLGEGYADSIAAIIELTRREVITQRGEKPGIQSPGDGAALVQYEMSCLDHEELWVALLNTRNKLIRIVKLYKGTLNASTVRVGEVFRDAIKENAASIVIFHNHPSGDPAPSPEDVALTRAIIASGKLLDIEVLDHVVIGANRYRSLKEQGLGFSS